MLMSEINGRRIILKLASYSVFQTGNLNLSLWQRVLSFWEKEKKKKKLEVGSMVMQTGSETTFPYQEDPVEKSMATHFSIHNWRI